MSKWENLLKDDPTEWLLETGNPSVRYYTLRDILGKSKSSDDMKMLERKS